MIAYAVVAVFPEYGETPLKMLVYHAGPRADVERYLVADGWQVKRVREATMDDIHDLSPYEAVLRDTKAAIRQRRASQEEKERQARADRERRAMEERLKREARERAEADARQLAISKAAGDLFNLELEPGIRGNSKVAAICAKVGLFFDHASLNKCDLFTAMSIDFADFQSSFDFRATNKLLTALLADLNEFLKIDEGVAELRRQLTVDRVSVENKVNSIASRTHIFGGSGDWLLLSFLAANSAAKQDEKAIRALEDGHVHQAYRVQHAIEQAVMKQQLLEFRAKTACSLLLAACGKAHSIEINLPDGVEMYVLGAK